FRTVLPMLEVFTSFFAAVVITRAPYSFPTRRSSDLGRRWSFPRSHQRCPTSGCSSGLPAQCHGEECGEDRVSLGGFWGRCPLPKDRKSTRLNSSHVSSSYAVFCLKKKTTRYPARRRADRARERSASVRRAWKRAPSA